MQQLWPRNSKDVDLLVVLWQQSWGSGHNEGESRTCPHVHVLSVLVDWHCGCQKSRLLTHLLGYGKSLTWGQRVRGGVKKRKQKGKKIIYNNKREWKKGCGTGTTSVCGPSSKNCMKYQRNRNRNAPCTLKKSARGTDPFISPAAPRQEWDMLVKG